MLNHINSSIEKLSVHRIGNKNNDEDLVLSKDVLDIANEELKGLLIKFFLQPFVNPEYYNFTFSNKDVTLNPMYRFATAIFENQIDFHINSEYIAKQLYELSNHPQIKSGDLFVVYFTDIMLDNIAYEAVGVFKSENKHAFLKIEEGKDFFSINSEEGINIEKLDKGCLILNIDKENGYKVCIVDKSNKSSEAQYWKDQFLLLTVCKDDYHHTKQFMNITKNFVAKQLTEDFDVTRTDQIELLKKSVDYFKKKDTFDIKEFEEEVFQDKAVIKSFRSFDNEYRTDNNLEIADTFEISDQAVKKQAKIFKSVLKLDKNFHIYIHGDNRMIEQGVDDDGRKFYKIYYKEEQ
ncbi:MAG: hypothetical protein K0S44_749 [Bacteroidetes bacterium]|jgi:hypothetical protein|nr:hypothetical protein [Bacteroidota bacterium]